MHPRHRSEGTHGLLVPRHQHASASDRVRDQLPPYPARWKMPIRQPPLPRPHGSCPTGATVLHRYREGAIGPQWHRRRTVGPSPPRTPNACGATEARWRDWRDETVGRQPVRAARGVRRAAAWRGRDARCTELGPDGPLYRALWERRGFVSYESLAGVEDLDDLIERTVAYKRGRLRRWKSEPAPAPCAGPVRAT